MYRGILLVVVGCLAVTPSSVTQASEKKSKALTSRPSDLNSADQKRLQDALRQREKADAQRRAAERRLNSPNKKKGNCNWC